MLLAVSGGADSTAMLRGLARLSASLQVKIYAAHLDHGLRMPQSRLDAEWLQDLAHAQGIELEVERRDVAAAAAACRSGVEETARRLRYQFLESAALKFECSAVVLAHTRDDQAETILHHILRGTGLSGLIGIPRRRRLDSGITILRPMLEVSRRGVLDYLDSIHQTFREDESNQDLRYTRNRIRQKLMPALRDEFNPQVEQALLRLSRQASEVQAVLAPLSQKLLAQSLLEPEPGSTEQPKPTEIDGKQLCRMDVSVLSDQPRHLVRECFRRLWQQMDWPLQKMGFDEWDHLVNCVGQAGVVCLPGGVRGECRDGVLRLELMNVLCRCSRSLHAVRTTLSGVLGSGRQ